jgi:hypothetical protein
LFHDRDPVFVSVNPRSVPFGFQFKLIDRLHFLPHNNSRRKQTEYHSEYDCQDAYPVACPVEKYFIVLCFRHGRILG